jgi:S1-C subfamily serine protease
MMRQIHRLLMPIAAVGALTVAACRDAQAGRALEQASVYIQVESLGADDKPTSATGSGVCLLPSGLVVTNQHVVRRANTVRVVFHAATPEEYQCAAEVLGVHPDRDLALLQCRSDRPLPWISLGSTRDLRLTDTVHCIGFPLGALMADGNRNPSVSIAVGSVAALRTDGDGRLAWIDVGAPVAGGNSDSAVLDDAGQLIGILTQRYEGFGRATPVEYVKELLGEAALDVQFDPEVAPAEGGRVRVTVAPRDSVAELTSGRISLAGDGESPIRLKPDGFELRYVAGLNRVPQPRIALRGVIHSITLERLKANGWRWDADEPDPFCKLYVNDLLVKQTPAVRNQYRFRDLPGSVVPISCLRRTDLDVKNDPGSPQT